MADSCLELFQKVSDRMRVNTSLKLTNEQKLELYGYYKQATEGKCFTSKPGLFDFTGRAKWEAWNKLGTLDKESAMTNYIALVNKIDPNWQSTPAVEKTGEDTKESVTGGPVVSTLAEKTEDIPENQKNLFDWCKEGRCDKVEECIKAEQAVNRKDDQGMAPLHWACDRGNTEIVQCLLENGAHIKSQDSDGQTPLHYAASCGHSEVLSLLLANGADKNRTDSNGETPLDICDSSVRNLLV